jgi:hypothetical protein
MARLREETTMGATGDWIFGTVCLVFAVVMVARDFMPDSRVERWKRDRGVSRDPQARRPAQSYAQRINPGSEAERTRDGAGSTK